MYTTPLLAIGVLFISCTRVFGHTHGPEKRAVASVYTACTKPKTAAITYVRLPQWYLAVSPSFTSFDDGPNTYTKTIVDTFDKAGGKV